MTTIPETPAAASAPEAPPSGAAPPPGPAEAPPPPPEPAFQQYKGKLLMRQNLGLWDGLIPVEVPALSGTPTIRWAGGKLPLELVLKLLAFFRHINETHKSEAQARLAYNPRTMEWRAMVLPQYVGTGMVSNELKVLTAEEQEQKNLILEDGLEGGFMLCGTAHSHCDSGAFASLVDDTDEITQTGLHFTLGKVSGERPELHGRVVFRGVKYAICWSDWLAHWPDKLDPAKPDFHLAIPKDYKLPEFPELWTRACLQRPKTKGYGYGYGYSYIDDGDDFPAAGSWRGTADGAAATPEYYRTRRYLTEQRRMESLAEWRTRIAKTKPTDITPTEYYRERNWLVKLSRMETVGEWRARKRRETAAAAKEARKTAKKEKRKAAADEPAPKEAGEPAGAESARKRFWTAALVGAYARLMRGGESFTFTECVLRRALENRESDPSFSFPELREMVDDVLDTFLEAYNSARDVGDMLGISANTVCSALQEALGPALDDRATPFTADIPEEIYISKPAAEAQGAAAPDLAKAPAEVEAAAAAAGNEAAPEDAGL